MIDPDSFEANKATLAILSGSKVLVWDVSSSIGDNGNDRDQNEANVRAFDPYPQYDDSVPISNLAWNHNQMVIATSSGISTDDLAHDNVVLVSSQSGQTLDSFQHDSQWKQKQQCTRNYNHQGSAVKSINFGGKSRYLCIGDESGAVCLWDLKKKIRVRQFFHRKSSGDPDINNCSDSTYPSPSYQVSLDPTDTYVLSLSPLALYQYNLRDGQLVGTLKVPNNDDGHDIDNDCFTLFSISDLEPNLCAIGTDNGSIYIHDITNYHNQYQASPLLEMTQRHSGDVTGLAYSPVHPDTLYSCGNDGVIIIHNKSERRSQKICGALDSNNSSIQSMSLHANGVTCAVGCKSGDVFVYNFQENINKSEITSTLLASFQANDPIHSLFFAPPPRPKDKQRQSGKSTSSTNENNNESSSGTTTQSALTTAPINSAPSEMQREHTKKSVLTQQKRDSPTSPISPQYYERSSCSMTHATESKNKARVTSPFAKKLASLTSNAKKALPGDTQQQKMTTGDVGSSKRTEKVPLSPKKLPSSPARKHNSRTRPRESIQKAETQKSEKNNAEKIREVVREEVENLQDELEEQLRNLHIDMINQFHQQSQEIETELSKHFSALERLTAENQHLREENERLRRGQQA